jgi:hypothetical protein
MSEVDSIIESQLHWCPHKPHVVAYNTLAKTSTLLLIVLPLHFLPPPSPPLAKSF